MTLLKFRIPRDVRDVPGDPHLLLRTFVKLLQATGQQVLQRRSLPRSRPATRRPEEPVPAKPPRSSTTTTGITIALRSENLGVYVLRVAWVEAERRRVLLAGVVVVVLVVIVGPAGA